MHLAALELGWSPPSEEQRKFSRYYQELVSNAAKMIKSGKLRLEQLDPQIREPNHVKRDKGMSG